VPVLGTLSGMTSPPSPATAAPLLTDHDVLRRVEALIGPALQDGTLWLLFVDGDHRQSPVVVPVEDVPRLPDAMVAGLGQVVEEVLPDLATAAGPGAVVFVRERLGRDEVVPDDRVWAAALTAMCRARRLALRGVHLATPGGVRRIR
jgi:hypothetical protein